MILTIYVILLIVAGGSLIIGVKSERWIFSLFSLVLFLVLSFQSYDIEVVSAGSTVSFVEPVMILINWLGSFFAFAVTLYGAISTLKMRKASKQNQGPIYG